MKKGKAALLVVGVVVALAVSGLGWAIAYEKGPFARHDKPPPPIDPMPTPNPVVDADGDGLPDDKENAWGYSTSENDVRLTIHIQKSTDYDKYKAGIDKAVALLAKDYREKNPLHINLHVDYGEDLPAGKILPTKDVDNQILNNIKTKNLETSLSGEYKYHGYFIEDWFTELPGSNADGMVGYKGFNIHVDFHSIVDNEYPAHLKELMDNELGGALGLKDSPHKTSVMATSASAGPHDWRLNTEYREDEWTKDKINFKFE